MELSVSDSLVLENPEEVAAAGEGSRRDGPGFSVQMVIPAAAERDSATPLYTFERRLSRLDGAGLLEPCMEKST